MDKEIQMGRKTSFLLFLGLIVFLPSMIWAAETPTMAIEEAKFAIEQARKAGAEKRGYDDLAAAKSWLSRAEKEYSEARSFFYRLSTSTTQKAKEDEIIYLAAMAKIKSMTAEAKAKKGATIDEIEDTQKEVSNYQNAIALLNKKLVEAEKAKELQAKAEAERKEMEEAKRQASEMEARKQRELDEAKKKTAEIEALRQKELEEARHREAQRAAEREKELAEAKQKAEQLAIQRAQEEAERKAKEEMLAGERQKLAALKEKTEALEREKAMLATAGKIPNVTIKTGEKEIFITILVIDLFTPANELKTSGKEILDNLGNFLKAYPNNKVIVRGHTDSTGKEAVNQALSEKRAQKVREYLVAYQDIQPTRVTTQGFGPSQPVTTNATEAGRALNRRVEIAIQTGE
ncbi:MAG: OmpA family protein [Thermodesulfobacteriota bacterium]|nr:OmpA family protein [Thermodesulfobacteriota bacterium]